MGNDWLAQTSSSKEPSALLQLNGKALVRDQHDGFKPLTGITTSPTQAGEKCNDVTNAVSNP